jgi:hypothetical protein
MLLLSPLDPPAGYVRGRYRSGGSKETTTSQPGTLEELNANRDPAKAAKAGCLDLLRKLEKLVWAPVGVWEKWRQERRNSKEAEEIVSHERRVQARARALAREIVRRGGVPFPPWKRGIRITEKGVGGTVDGSGSELGEEAGWVDVEIEPESGETMRRRDRGVLKRFGDAVCKGWEVYCQGWGDLGMWLCREENLVLRCSLFANLVLIVGVIAVVAYVSSGF